MCSNMIHDTERFIFRRLLINVMAREDWGVSDSIDDKTDRTGDEKGRPPSSRSTKEMDVTGPDPDQSLSRPRKKAHKITTGGKRKKKLERDPPKQERTKTLPNKRAHDFELTSHALKMLGIIIVIFLIICSIASYFYFFAGLDDQDEPVEVLEDSDGDGLDDAWEEEHGLDPANPDTDGDSMPDGWEEQYNLDPKDPTDADMDIDQDGYDSNHNGQLDAAELYTNLAEYIAGTNPKDKDTDNDGMHDGWESYYGERCLELKNNIQKYNPPGRRDYNYTLDPTDPADAAEDIDVDVNLNIAPDSLTNLQEFMNGTDPTKPDSDSDNLTDDQEILKYHTDPLDLDTDNDGLYDGWEIKFDPSGLSLNPLLNDTDGDGVTDTREDLDNDTLYNLYESYLGTSPVSNDTDRDGLPDDWEDRHGTAPTLKDGDADPDADGLENMQEYLFGTNPADLDSDDDNLTDGDELLSGFHGLLETGEGKFYSTPDMPLYFTNPTSNDTDGDGIKDGEEVSGAKGYVTNATCNDTDGDGIFDNEELEAGEDGFTTDPTNRDTDGDRLTDKEEVDAFWGITQGYKTFPTLSDSDGDALLDGDEVLTDFLPFTTA